MSISEKQKEELKKAAQDTESKYGFKSASSGRTSYKTNGALSTGSLLWDYMTGIGGSPANQGVEVFGPPTIGKSTIALYSGAFKSAQALGMKVGLIAVEPVTQEDEDWMEQLGLDLDGILIGRPDTGEEAFGMAHDWVFNKTVDYIGFDSIGAITSENEQNSDKKQAFGNAGLITWGVNRLPQRMWKNNIGIMYINQIRDDNSTRIQGLVKSPGGHAAKHAFRMRTQLKPGKDRYTMKMSDGVENKDVMVGRQIVAVFQKNRVAEALGRSARFDYYHIDTDGEYPFGFDIAKDIIAAAKVSGVFETAGAWLKHNVFPGGKLNGARAVHEWVAENPDKVGVIRDDVIAVMKEEQAKKAAAKRRAKAAGKVESKK
jgi:recombination protein RecA